MSFLFGTQNNTQKTTEPRTPTEIHEISMRRLQRRNDIDDGYYRVNTKRGVYLGEIRDRQMNGLGRYTWNNGDFEDGVWKNSRFLSGSRKRNNITYTGINVGEVGDETLSSLDGTIDFGNGITFNGFVENDMPVKGDYTIAPNTIIEFQEWRGIKSGNKGILTRDGEWWVQTYTTGPVKEFRSESFNARSMRVCGRGRIRITFRDGGVYNGKTYLINDVEGLFDDSFIEGPTVVNDFRNWTNYQLDYWLVANRNLDHFPTEFFLNIRECNITGAQLLNFDNCSLSNIGLRLPLLRSQLTTLLKRFNNTGLN